MKTLQPELIKSLSPKEKVELSQLLEIYKFRWSLNARKEQAIPQGADPRSGRIKIPLLCAIILSIQISFSENGGLHQTNPNQGSSSPF